MGGHEDTDPGRVETLIVGSVRRLIPPSRPALAAIGHAGPMPIEELMEPARRAAEQLRSRGETVAVAEGSAGGLVSAALLAVPGASAYYRGGVVVYTGAAHRAWIAPSVEVPADLRGATEGFAGHVARGAAAALGATWGVGEAGAAGPPNRYGDPAGHCWVAVTGPRTATRQVLTGSDERATNMGAFAAAALELLVEVMAEAGPPSTT